MRVQVHRYNLLGTVRIVPANGSKRWEDAIQALWKVAAVVLAAVGRPHVLRDGHSALTLHPAVFFIRNHTGHYIRLAQAVIPEDLAHVALQVGPGPVIGSNLLRHHVSEGEGGAARNRVVVVLARVQVATGVGGVDVVLLDGLALHYSLLHSLRWSREQDHVAVGLGVGQLEGRETRKI